MTKAQAAVFPAAIIGCLLVAWIGTMAAANFPVALLTPTAVVIETTVAGVPTEGQAALVAEQAGLQSAVNEQPTPAPSEPAPADAAPAEAAPAEAAQSSECNLSARYSDSVRQWCDLIQRFAGEYNLEANLLAAVMTQESGGNPSAISRSGAVGLMQVMPRDGLAASFMCINGPCFASRPSTDELLDPAFNLQFGARMLAGLISKAGSVRDGLMRYGPGNVGYYYADKVLAIYERYQ